MATTPTPVSFSGRDYTTEVERLRQRAITLLTEWTDHNYSDPGEVLIALQGTTTDLINAVVDNYAQENFLDARFRQSLIDQGKKLGYLPTLASAATTRLLLTRKAGITGAITIPQWSIFARSDGLEYVTTDAVTIATDEDAVEVNAIQGTRVSYTLTSDDFAINDWSRRPKYNLGTNVAAGTVTTTHSDGAFMWTNIDTWWRVAATDMAFLLELNGDNDTVWLTLGNGIRGQGPVAEDMTVTFIRTSAASGNCGTGVITLAPEALAVSITCSNIEMATGGAPSETRESLRESLPDRASIQRRAVSSREHDYKKLVEPIPGVLHCQEFDINDSREWPHQTVAMYVVPEGGGPMSSALKDLIWAELCQKGSLGFWQGRYLLYDADEKVVAFALRVGIVQGYNSTAVQSAIDTNLTAFFAPANRAIGETISFSLLHSTISIVPGVSWVEFDAPTGDVVCSSSEFPVYGGLTVVFQ